MMGQVNYVRIIDRQVNNARIIGPERMDSDSSCVSLLCRPAVQRKALWIFNRCLWRSAQFWLHEGAGCHGLVGPGSARRRGRRSFFLIRVLGWFCRSSLQEQEQLTIWHYGTMRACVLACCWQLVYISTLKRAQKGTLLRFVRLNLRKRTAGGTWRVFQKKEMKNIHGN